MPTLDHVGLPVRDPAASVAFYRDVLGLDGDIRAEEDGYVITTPSDVVLTLFRGEAPKSMGDFHIGLGLDSPTAVSAARDQFRAQGLTEHEWSDDPGYVSVKVVDPDGYVVEVFWEDHQARLTS